MVGICRNHVIPRFIIKRFADHSGNIWYGRKPNQGGDFKLKHINYTKTFVRKNFYDDETEHKLAELESNVSSIVNRIDKEGAEQLFVHAYEKLILCEFIGIQLLRSEKSVHQMMSSNSIDQYMREYYPLKRPHPREFRKAYMSFIRDMLNGGIREWIYPSGVVPGQLTLDDIHIIGIPETSNTSFIVGDSLSLIHEKRPSELDITQHNNTFIDPNCIKVMPIAPKLAIALFKKGALSDAPLDELVCGINHSMFNNSLSIGAYAKKSINLLAQHPHTIKTCQDTLDGDAPALVLTPHEE